MDAFGRGQWPKLSRLVKEFEGKLEQPVAFVHRLRILPTFVLFLKKLGRLSISVFSCA